MFLLILCSMIIGCWGNIKVSIDKTGAYTIRVNGIDWLHSSQTGLYADDKWYSSTDQSLPLMNITTARGTDQYLGSWNETQLNYDLHRNGMHTKIVASIRQWHKISAITFHLNTGDQMLTNSNPLDKNQVRTIFPSMKIEKLDVHDNRSYFTFEGVMTGDGDKHAGNWNSSSRVIHSGFEGGPVIVFNETQRGEGDVLILCPFSRFMATTLTQTTNILEYGVIGSILSITPNYNHSFIIFYSSNGINEGVRQWGQAMQKAYNRTDKYRNNDLTINYLGYYTDNGAYYYYNTEKDNNYEQTMLDVISNISLPIKYLQIDSWWYYKGIGEGVSEWVARPDIFPNGLPAFHRKANNMPLVAHNRYWAYDTIYKKNYSFVFDEKTGKSLPVGNDSFWIDLFTQGKQWGLMVYEQDWLVTQTKDFEPLYTDIHLGHQWLISMGEAAEKLNITIQYCMSLPRHILTALEIPRVTQTRVSTDYALHLEGKTQQWTIGISSMFADAMGIAPFKDVFWSTPSQPGSTNYTPTAHEIVTKREIAMATLSTGPVSPGDGIQHSNYDKVMQCCRADGLILKPDHPVTMINALISDWALNGGISQGEVYSTKTTIDNDTFHLIFASTMTRDYVIYPSMIGAKPGVIYIYDGYTVPKRFDESHPLTIPFDRCHELNLCVWYVSPVWKFKDYRSWALLMEDHKWAGITKQRYKSIVHDSENAQIIITAQGLFNEPIDITFADDIEGLSGYRCWTSDTNDTVHFIVTPDGVNCA